MARLTKFHRQQAGKRGPKPGGAGQSHSFLASSRENISREHVLWGFVAGAKCETTIWEGFSRLLNFSFHHHKP
jgi:hypothetical protein